MEVEKIDEENRGSQTILPTNWLMILVNLTQPWNWAITSFRPLTLLDQHGATGGITINQEELEENKNKIVETLKNYKIGIAQIKATIGPTVTLYEIVPDAGMRISKIKNLEDDIALSLAALGNTYYCAYSW